MAVEELATQRLGKRLQSNRCWVCEKESRRGSSKFFFGETRLLERGRQIVLRRTQRGIDRGVDRLVWRKIGLVTDFSAALVASQVLTIGIRKHSMRE